MASEPQLQGFSRNSHHQTETALDWPTPPLFCTCSSGMDNGPGSLWVGACPKEFGETLHTPAARWMFGGGRAFLPRWACHLDPHAELEGEKGAAFKRAGSGPSPFPAPAGWSGLDPFMGEGQSVFYICVYIFFLSSELSTRRFLPISAAVSVVISGSGRAWGGVD